MVEIKGGDFGILPELKNVVKRAGTDESQVVQWLMKSQLTFAVPLVVADCVDWL